MKIKRPPPADGRSQSWDWLWLFFPPAFSQNCALCYTQAASSGSRMIEALRSGILVLIVPPTLMWMVLGAILYAKRNHFKRADIRP